MAPKMKTHLNSSREFFENNNLYVKNSDGKFFSPFNMSIDDMEHLILINFEKDPDKLYNTFELQQASDKSGKKSYLVIAYSNDGSSDVYHQADYPFASQASILNDASFIVSPLKNVRFEINADRLDVFFAFEDRVGRMIKVKVTENRRQNKKPFFLLAPVGVISRKPSSLPIYSLYEMAFTKRKYTQIEIEIDKVKHKPDTFPIPIDCSKNYFTRYSTDTFNVDWNKNYDGPLFPIIPDKNNRTEDKEIIYELINNQGHYEIKRISTGNRKHRLNIDFSPQIPDIACLNNEIYFNGKFSITTDNSAGVIKGLYHLEKKGKAIELQFQPIKGWQPNENRLGIKFLFLLVKVFREWPKSYVWNATILMDETDQVIMKSAWKRI